MTSGIVLPQPIPTVSGWQLVDWIDPGFTSPPAAGGVATIEVPQLGPDELWLVDHMVAYIDSSTATRMRLYVDQASPRSLRDGTDTGNFDVADWPQGLLIRPSRQPVAQWTGASDGAVATLTLQARVLRRVT